MKKVFFLAPICFAVAMCLFCGCSPDDENDIHTSSTATTTTRKISAPKFDKHLTTTDLDGFIIRVRFKTGGDKESNLSATVHWKSYSKNQALLQLKKNSPKWKV